MFECHITNGLSQVGLAVRYFGYTLIKEDKKTRVALPGFLKRSEILDTNIINYYLPYFF